MAVVTKKEWLALREVDVSAVTKQKNGCDYVSWGDLEVLMAMHLPEGISMVHTVRDLASDHACIVTRVINGSLVDEYWYPVDGGFKNDSVEDPDSRDITDSMQRAGVKAIARATGLGHKLFEAVGGEEVRTGSGSGLRSKAANKDGAAGAPKRSFGRKRI